MRNFLFTIILMCTLSATKCFALGEQLNTPQSVVLHYSIYDPNIKKEKIPRSPSVSQTVYLLDNVITFSPYDITFTMELWEEDTDELVYHKTVLAGDTSITIPQALTGEYIIKFIFGNYMYWGYITL